MSNGNQEKIDNMKARFDDVKSQSGSETMCMAKWLQSTLYMANGFTHSCHHPSAHKIPVESLTEPSRLHNTVIKIVARNEMLNNEKPSECSYCWDIEKQGHMSDRLYKSSATSWSYPHLQKVIESKDGSNINPSYMEVSFDNTCNLKCMYCTPDVSSKWMQESIQHGAYNTSYKVGDIEWLKQSGRLPIPNREHNPYVEAFFNWWPDLYKDLNVFRITGGEPLLSKNAWKSLEEIRSNPREDLILAINTNMMVDEAILTRFIDLYNEVKPKVKEFQVFTSCEAHGEQAEYIRYGLNYDQFMKNCDRFLSETDGKLNFMITYNGLSTTSFTKFLVDIKNMRIKFNKDAADNRIPFMINYLKWPQFQDVRIIPKDISIPLMEASLAFMKQKDHPVAMFYLEEIDQMERLIEYAKEGLPSDYRYRQNKDFGVFYPEYDRRKELDFHTVFPELSSFLTKVSK